MKIIHLLPRILSLAFVLFLSLFALDVFSEYSGWSAILPLLIHLIPIFILLAITLIAWKYDLVGAVVFLGFAILYVFLAGFDRPWSWYAGISLPSALVGGLFILSWYKKRPK
jgi:cell division protein FtsW (lipid II flippase)